MKYLLILSIISLKILPSYGQDAKPSKFETNIKLNARYLASVRVFSGKLDSTTYKTIKKDIENELNVEIQANTAILINYVQGASNCLLAGLNDTDVSRVIDNKKRISSQLCMANNAIDFFVFYPNADPKELFQKRDYFKKDSGFFYENIFTLHDNCDAFLILKPNGDFLKYYGEDYFSQVEKFFKRKRSPNLKTSVSLFSTTVTKKSR
ncbi:hypothetical protein [Pedobacter jejuensis]|uniref:Uncharacterized protein n=1 Tax=Pedobacter jejuensis TaxID=1268550 RepID=A0A3N0BX09_9SPHI|nr:hypothetical protein [Pedobacter jejuensis]RNL54211.1 hypothetical protein D7004_08960 [Pedobacter jejuensis]